MSTSETIAMAVDVDAVSTATPGEPRWVLSGVYAGVVTAALSWIGWPGLMSYDSLYAYREAKLGIQTMLWPPMHAYLFWLSQHLGADAWGVLVFQVFLLFFAAAVGLNLLVRSRLWAAAAIGAFTLAFVAVPELMGDAMVQWRDVVTTSFAMAGLAAWLMATRYRSKPWLVIAAALLGLSAALRYNTILLLVLVLPVMVWRPFLTPARTFRSREAVLAALIASLGLAWASTHWRLPDLAAMPNPNSFSGTQEFDLLGISACADKTYLPPAMTEGWPITPAQIRKLYDPRHLEKAMQPLAGVPKVVDTAAGGQVAKAWRVAVREEFPCYLKHRAAVFVQQMGLAKTGVFYPMEYGIVENPYGLTPAHWPTLVRFESYVKVRQAELWRRPFLLYLLAPIVAAALWARRAHARWLFLALLGGAFAYPAALFIAAPAADARYIFPSNVFCAFILAAGAAVFADGWRPRGGSGQGGIDWSSASLRLEPRSAAGGFDLTLRLRWPSWRGRAPKPPTEPSPEPRSPGRTGAGRRSGGPRKGKAASRR